MDLTSVQSILSVCASYSFRPLCTLLLSHLAVICGPLQPHTSVLDDVQKEYYSQTRVVMQEQNGLHPFKTLQQEILWNADDNTNISISRGYRNFVFSIPASFS